MASFRSLRGPFSNLASKQHLFRDPFPPPYLHQARNVTSAKSSAAVSNNVDHEPKISPARSTSIPRSPPRTTSWERSGAPDPRTNKASPSPCSARDDVIGHPDGTGAEPMNCGPYGPHDDCHSLYFPPRRLVPRAMRDLAFLAHVVGECL